MSYRAFAAILIAGTILDGVAGASGNGGSRADDAPQVNACALLETAEIEDILGLRVGTGMRSDSGYESNGSYSSTCMWPIAANRTDSASPADGRRFVIVNAMRWPDGSQRAGSFLDSFRKAAETGELSAAPAARDFGDEALWWGDGLAVVKGDVSFGVSVFIPGTKPDKPGAIEEKLAPHILRRLARLESDETHL